MKRSTNIRLFGIIGLVCLITLAMVSAAAADPNVCRDLPATAEPGDTITVTLDVTVDGADKTAISDVVPAGWVISNPSNGGGIAGTTVFWATGAAPAAQYTYDVTIPDGAADGVYPFNGQFSLIAGEPLADIVCGDGAITVEEEVVVEPEPEGIVIKEGMNYISVPFALNNSSVEFVLADINYTTIMYWNASAANCTGLWEIPTDFEPLKAYWIESIESEDQIITVVALEPMVPAVPPTMTVCPGWNAVGYTDSMTTLSAELALSSIDDSYTLVEGPYNPETMNMDQIGHNGETGVIAGSHVGTDVFEMNPYEGFWVYVTQEDTLVGF